MGKPKPSSRPPDLALVALALIVSVSVLASMRPVPAMALAILAAVGWCLWLEDHPPLDL
jgi:hypothetical protein